MVFSPFIPLDEMLIDGDGTAVWKNGQWKMKDEILTNVIKIINISIIAGDQ